MKGLLAKMSSTSFKISERNFLSLLEKISSVMLCDLGCGDGEFTLKAAKNIGTRRIYGIDLFTNCVEASKQKGIHVINADLNQGLPFADKTFDVVISSQVIEHLVQTDTFVTEINRVLKSDGYAIISTENLASWHNIFALLLGYRPFSQDCSSYVKIGNPLSIHYQDKITDVGLLHHKIFTYTALTELFEIHGFKVENVLGGGYYPFPSFLSRIFSRWDPRHAHFLVIKVRKKKDLISAGF